MSRLTALKGWLPEWLRPYRAQWLSGDLTAGFIVTVMLIPQSLAYAMLAGLPLQVGIYASIAPLVVYALFGTSMTLAVGPVAVASLMTASALTPLAAPGSPEYVALAVQLAMLSGLMLFAFGMLRLGAVAHFLSHPVISGFISGSALLIALSQLKHVLGVEAAGRGVWNNLVGLAQGLPTLNGTTAMIGVSSLAFLWWARGGLPRLLQRVGVADGLAATLAKLAPMLAVVAATVAVALGQLHLTAGVKVVGEVPAGLPSLAWEAFDWSNVSVLWVPALLIGLVGFVESVSVAQSLAIKRKQRIVPNRELLGLGAANMASAMSGGYPVTGGFARSVVNFAAGAQTPLAGVISAFLMAVLWVPALLIGLVGFVESVSVAQSLAIKRKQRIVPNRELLGLGAANMASAMSGGYPVTGGFARSVVNFAAGAQTPLAGVISAFLMAVVLVGLTDWFRLLPQAVLAATIVVAVTSLIDLSTLRRAWRYDRADAAALLATAAGVLALGVEAGVLLGVALSLGVVVWRSSHPHMAVVGRVPGTEHFRNVSRHRVETVDGVLAVRIDENLFFANAHEVETQLQQLSAEQSPPVRRVLLIMSAVNRIDSTALDMLEAFDQQLTSRGQELWLAEVKGPVADRLARSDLGQRLQARIVLSAHEAMQRFSVT